MTMPAALCTQCGAVIDQAICATTAGDAEPGAYTVCGLCGHLMAFTNELQLRNLTMHELRELARDDVVLRIKRAKGGTA